MKRHDRRALRRWSYATLEEVPRDLTGIYTFWYRRTGRCIYVGETSRQTVQVRLRQHWLGSHNETLNLWIRAYGNDLDVCYAPFDGDRVKTLERRLIRRWKPEANKKHNR